MDNLKGTLTRGSGGAGGGGGGGGSGGGIVGDSLFSIRIDAEIKKLLKLVFIKLLNQIGESVQAEQQFCAEFFNPKLVTGDNLSQITTANNPLTRTGSSNSLQSSNSMNLSRHSNESSSTQSNKLEL